MLRRPVDLDQANVEVESVLRDRRAKIDGQRSGSPDRSEWSTSARRMVAAAPPPNGPTNAQ